MTREELEMIAQRPSYCKPFGAGVTLSVGERDELVAMARQAIGSIPAIDPDDSQPWGQTDPATAFHLIDRHAENWADAGVLMERWARAWVAANPAAKEEA